MVSTVLSCTIKGLEAIPVHVELDMTGGLPGLTIVGMGDTAIRESRERVLAALRNSGYELPPSRVTVNLAPADLKKEGSRFDLPIALGILAALRAFPSDALDGYMVMGELSLTGDIVGREAAFPAALLARKAGIAGMILPREMASEASLVTGCTPLPTTHLSEITEYLRGRRELEAVIPPFVRNPDTILDLGEVAGDSGQWSVAAPGTTPNPENTPLSYKLRQEIRRQREEVERAERRLRALEIEADLAEVPAEWRAPDVGRRPKDSAQTPDGAERVTQ